MNALPSTPLRRVALVASLLVAGQLQAHQIWIEQPAAGQKDQKAQKAQNATLYFGEFGENLRETSPGLLDKFVKPVAQKLTAKGAEPVDIRKTPGGFAIAARAAAGESIVAEEIGYPISERKDGDKTVRSLYHPAARLVTSLARQEPSLTLDLVPTGQSGKGGVEVQAFYKGQPLPKAKVAIVTPSGWAQEHRTDEQGKLTVQLPWRGTYVLELSHNDNTGGERHAETYTRASYVTSLTLPSRQGLPALPAPPAATPNQ